MSCVLMLSEWNVALISVNLNSIDDNVPEPVLASLTFL